jgi:diacylglycerol kinase (ATP)
MSTPIKKRIDSFLWAFKGIGDAMKTQVHLRVHAVLAIMALSACYWFSVAPWEWVAVILCIGLVAGMEIMNTAVEYVVNLVSPEFHPLAGKAKDAAAGAVLVVALAALAVGLCIFGPKLISLST